MAQNSGVVGFIARRLFGAQPVDEDTDEDDINENGQSCIPSGPVKASFRVCGCELIAWSCSDPSDPTSYFLCLAKECS